MGPPPLDPILGKVLQGKYRIENHIASGAMGAVYRGRQLAVERNVAVKILKLPDTLKGDDRTRMVRRFEREARLTSRLQHPNSIRVFDYGETEDGRPYLVMELLRGPTLKAVLRSEGHLSAWRVARIARQMCKALQEAHSLGVVHRDLKPDNVFLVDFEGERDFVKVVDYGIARVTGGGDTDQESMTHTGTTLGTPKYMSPEQALGRTVSARTDLYALGVMIYELLTGQAPYHADNPIATAMQHVSAPIPPLPPIGLPIEVEEGWRALVARLMAKKADDRPSSAATVAAALEHLEIRSREAMGVGSDTEEEIVALLRAPELAENVDAEGGPTQVTVANEDATQATDVVEAAQALAARASRPPPLPPGPTAPTGTEAIPIPVQAPPPEPKRRRGPLTIVLGGAALLAVGYGIAALADRSTPSGGSQPPVAGSQTSTPPDPAHVPNDAKDAGATVPTTDAASAVPAADAGPTSADARTIAAGDGAAHPADAAGGGAQASADARSTPADTADAAGTASGAAATTAHLVLTSEPTNAHVFLDKEELCQTTCERELPPGKVSLRVTRPGYRDRTVTLDLKAGETTEEKVRLPRVTTTGQKPPGNTLPPIRLGPK